VNRSGGLRGRAPAVGDMWEAPRTPVVGDRCWRRALRRREGRGGGGGGRGKGGCCVGAMGRGAGFGGHGAGAGVVDGVVSWREGEGEEEEGTRGGGGGSTHRVTTDTAEDSVLPERVV
jgi:hypothetical protein